MSEVTLDEVAAEAEFEIPLTQSTQPNASQIPTQIVSAPAEPAPAPAPAPEPAPEPAPAPAAGAVEAWTLDTEYYPPSAVLVAKETDFNAARLISAVRPFNLLYDKAMVAYRKEVLKKEAWLAVAAEMGWTGDFLIYCSALSAFHSVIYCSTLWRSFRLAVKQCKDTWKGLCDTLRVVKKKPKSGSGGGAKEWLHFKAMAFMIPYQVTKG